MATYTTTHNPKNTTTPTLDAIALETLDYIVTNLGDHTHQYPMDNDAYALMELFDLMDSLDFSFGPEATQLLLLNYFSNHQAAFNTMPEELRLSLFGTTLAT